MYMNTKITTQTLKNSLTLKLLQNKFLHSINIGVYVRKVPEGVCGLAHLVEHMFFRKLSDFSQNELYVETDSIGATFKAVTYADFICFDILAPPSKMREAFDIISRIFRRFEWSADDITAEKEVVKRQIEQRYNSLYDKADRAYYKGTLMGTLLMGNLSDVDKMSTKAVNNYKSKMFVPSNSCVVITGNFSNEDLLYCEKRLEQIPYIETDNETDNQAACHGYKIFDFANRTYQSDKIYPVGDDFSDVSISFDIDTQKVNRYAAEILCSIIGFGVTSKLSQMLRESLGLVSEVYGNSEFFDFSGRITFEYEISNQNLINSLNAAFDVIRNSKHGLTQADIDSNSIFYTENQYRLLDNARELNFMIGWRDFIRNENIYSIEALSEKYADITIADINSVAKELFSAQNLIISVSNNNKRFSKRKLAAAIASCRNRLED